METEPFPSANLVPLHQTVSVPATSTRTDIGRTLPPSAQPLPAPVTINKTYPAAIGGIAAGITFTQSLFMGGVMSSLAYAAYVGTLVGFTALFTAWIVASIIERRRTAMFFAAIDAEFQAPYSRYRVKSRAEGTEVVLELVEYRPRHSADGLPSYQQTVVDEVRHDADSDTEIFESLAELQELAEDYEAAAATVWERTLRALEIETTVRQSLNYSH